MMTPARERMPDSTPRMGGNRSNMSLESIDPAGAVP